MTGLLEKKQDSNTQPSDKKWQCGDDYSNLLENNFVELIESLSGIVFDHLKRRELKGNLCICMEEIGECSFRNYYNILSQSHVDDTHFKKLINFITINETYFFRVHEHFEILQKTVIPELIKNKEYGVKTINIWSAGASSGEEVYSIVIALLQIPGLKDKFRIKVLGTDINEEMLYIANKGIYSGRTLSKVPKSILDHYFEPFRERFRVKEFVKDYVEFQYLNLVNHINLGSFPRPDVIFFRNVLIYFSKSTTRKIIESFHQLLREDGFLFIGPSETLWEVSGKFDLLMFDRAYIYRKKKLKPGDETIGNTGQYGKPGESAEVENSNKQIFNVEYGTVDNKPHFQNLTIYGNEEFPNQSSFKDTPPVGKAEKEIVQKPQLFTSKKDKIRIKLDEAQLMIQLGEYDKAGELLEELLVMDKRNKPALLMKINFLLNQEKNEEALGLIEKTKKESPIFPELNYLYGAYLQSKGEMKTALSEFRKVLFIDQEYLIPRERMLKIYIATGDNENARREAVNIVEQLDSGHFKEFDYPVGLEINVKHLRKYCTNLLKSHQ